MSETLQYTLTPGAKVRAVVTVTSDGVVKIADDATVDELRWCLMVTARLAADCTRHHLKETT